METTSGWNSRGFLVAAFSKSVGFPLEAELAAILHAILFAFDCGWYSLWVESDSTLAIHTLQNRIQIVPWRLQGLWDKTQQALPHMRITSLTFFGKETKRLTLLLSFTLMKSGLVVVLSLLIPFCPEICTLIIFVVFILREVPFSSLRSFSLGRVLSWPMLRAPKFLLYADDILIFAKYGNISGQVFSPTKSTVYFGSSVSVSLRRRICRSTGVSLGSLPFDYLGVPIFRDAPKVHHLSRLVDSVICKFSRWKGSTLSLAGRGGAERHFSERNPSALITFFIWNFPEECSITDLKFECNRAAENRILPLAGGTVSPSPDNELDKELDTEQPRAKLATGNQTKADDGNPTRVEKGSDKSMAV
ncbi:hypothetical protein ACS0TY_006555 [Phlomoides rotata]